MKFKLDENLPDELVSYLHLAGHDADTVGDEKLRCGVLRFMQSQLNELLSRGLADRVTLGAAQRIRGH